MNCTEFREHWSAWHEGWPECDPDGMRTHWRACAACAEHDRQMRRLTEALAALPPVADAEKVDVRRGLAPRWTALAATLVVGIVLGLLWADGDRFDRADPAAAIEAAPVTLGASGEERISIAVESPRSYADVEFLVELPQGVELAGFPGQRSVSWRGHLAEGRSRLQLPLRMTSEMAVDGVLITRIRHSDGERRLVVPLRREGLSKLPGGIPA